VSNIQDLSCDVLLANILVDNDRLDGKFFQLGGWTEALYDQVSMIKSCALAYVPKPSEVAVTGRRPSIQ
jgi:hypothetical protein